LCADIVRNINESIEVTETVNHVTNFEKYGVQGSNPLGAYKQRTNVMLRDAVETLWDTVTKDPQASEINFSTKWTSDFSEVDLVFLLNVSTDPNLRGQRSTDWSLVTVVDTIDIHIFVRGAGGEEEVDTLGKVERALKQIIKTHTNSLIPFAHFNYVRTATAPLQRPDDLQTAWHDIMTVECIYMERTAVTV